MAALERAQTDLKKTVAELTRAEATVATLTQRLQKIQAYIEMAQVYEADAAPEDGGKARGSIAAATVAAAKAVLQERGARIHTKELLAELVSRGVAIGGSNPAGNLSGFLSKSDDLHASRSDGWGLKEWESEGAPNETKAAALIRKLKDINADPAPQPPVQSEKQETGGGWDATSDLDDEIPF